MSAITAPALLHQHSSCDNRRYEDSVLNSWHIDQLPTGNGIAFNWLLAAPVTSKVVSSRELANLALGQTSLIEAARLQVRLWGERRYEKYARSTS